MGSPVEIEAGMMFPDAFRAPVYWVRHRDGETSYGYSIGTPPAEVEVIDSEGEWERLRVAAAEAVQQRLEERERLELAERRAGGSGAERSG